MVKDFNSQINQALTITLKVQKNNSRKSQALHLDPIIFRLTCEENNAFQLYDNANLSEKSRYQDSWKKCKTRLKNAIRSKERNDFRHRIDKLETLRSHDPRAYWNALYELDHTTYNNSTIPTHVKTTSGVLVGGSEASKVWMDSFSNWDLRNPTFLTTIQHFM